MRDCQVSGVAAWRCVLVFLTLIALGDRPAAAQEPRPQPPDDSPRLLAIGAQVDLLPTILSASAGEVGGAGQIWFGREPLRLRAIGARLFMPAAIHGQDGFSALKTTAWALVLDYTFGERLDEWWLSSGLELWLHEVSIEESPEVANDWQSVVWTVGGGYIWRFAGDFYLDPWIAVHVPLNNQTVRVGSETFESLPAQPEASLKLGYFFEL